MITARDAASGIECFFANDVKSSAVAVELCKSSVTNAPDKKEVKRLLVPARITRLNEVP